MDQAALQSNTVEVCIPYGVATWRWCDMIFIDPFHPLTGNCHVIAWWFVLVFASKCQSECHAVKAALCDLGAPGWGIPGFRIELCCFLHPLKWPMVIL